MDEVNHMENQILNDQLSPNQLEFFEMMIEYIREVSSRPPPPALPELTEWWDIYATAHQHHGIDYEEQYCFTCNEDLVNPVHEACHYASKTHNLKVQIDYVNRLQISYHHRMLVPSEMFRLISRGLKEKLKTQCFAARCYQEFASEEDHLLHTSHVGLELRHYRDNPEDEWDWLYGSTDEVD